MCLKSWGTRNLTAVGYHIRQHPLQEFGPVLSSRGFKPVVLTSEVSEETNQGGSRTGKTSPLDYIHSHVIAWE